MKRVGICACYNTLNYGSMLQSFATQYVIDNLGYTSEFIKYTKKKDVVFVIKVFPRLFDRTLISDKLQMIQKRANISIRPAIKKEDAIRHQAFRRFQKEYYKRFSQEYYGYDALCEGARVYDAVVVGSDQLWLPGGLSTNFYNLMFVPDEIKKVSYATSFGVGSIPNCQHKKTREYLMRIQHISVREEAGAQIVEEMSGRKAQIVADPTILLSKNEWDTIMPKKRIVEEPYVFCYFLGRNEKHREIANEFWKKTGLKIVSTPFLDNFVKSDENFGHFRLYDIGPDDFVNLIRGAEYILTDSFHGSVFSIINHKKFVIFDRFNKNSKNSRNSRIDSLCNIMGLKNRRYSSNIVRTAMAEIDYSNVDNKLALLRKQSIDFLKNALEN